MKKEPHEIIEEIGAIVKNIWSFKEDPENLSKALNDIAVLNWGLAAWRSEFEEQERLMKGELNIEEADAILAAVKLGDSVAKANHMATVLLQDKRMTYLKMASQLGKVKTMMEANEKIMDAARSRLSLLKSEIGGRS